MCSDKLCFHGRQAQLMYILNAIFQGAPFAGQRDACRTKTNHLNPRRARISVYAICRIYHLLKGLDDRNDEQCGMMSESRNWRCSLPSQADRASKSDASKSL